MITLITDPDRFFADAAGDIAFRWPLVIVAVAGLAGVSSTMLFLSVLIDSLGGFGSVFFSVSVAFSLFGGTFGIFLVWLLHAGLFYSISLLFDGEGDFRTTVKYTGWGFLPAILSGIVAGAATYVAVSAVPTPESVAAFNTFTKQVTQRPVGQASLVVATLIGIWQGFIWLFAVKHARQLTLRQSFLTVVLPVTAGIVWNLRNLLA